MSTTLRQEEVARRSSASYPGLRATVDGSGAVVWVETHVGQGACAYPITPSTPMGEGFQVEVSKGRANLWNEKLFFVEPESEHSSASACEGFALAGGRVTSFTSGQGLVLMKEVLHVISGKRLPVVIHVGARALTSQALNIHCGHDDVMGVRDCGWGMLFGRNAQEAADLALIARRAAEDSQTPFLNVQDGFITTHTVESVLLPEPELMERFVGAPSRKLKSLFDPAHPTLSGPVQNQEAYMRGRVAQRWFTDRVPQALEDAFAEFALFTGRRYGALDAWRMEDAEVAIVGMGSMMETAKAAADWMRAERGWKVGVVHVTSFRPFPGREIVRLLRKCRAVAIVERTDDPLAQANPLAMEIQAAFAAAVGGAPGYPESTWTPRFFCGVAGLGGKDVRPGDFVEIADKLLVGRSGTFVVGVRHPLALERTIDPDVSPPGAFRMRGHSIGGFGSVTTNKVIASVSADVFGQHVQAFPKYGSEKKGLPTSYFLTLADEHVRLHGELAQVDLVAVHDLTAFGLGDPLAGIVRGGTLFLNTGLGDGDLWRALPAAARKRIREKDVRLLALDTQAIARELAPSPELASRMQGIALLGVFLAAAPFQKELGLSESQLFSSVDAALEKYFGKRGREVIEANRVCAQRGFRGARTVCIPPEGEESDVPEARESAAASCTAGSFGCVMAAYASGTEESLEADPEAARSLMPPGSGARRDFVHLAPEIPELVPASCVGCMECVNACPDSAILGKVALPGVLDWELRDVADETERAYLRSQFVVTQKFHTVPEKKGEAGGLFGLAIDPTKCKGCGECVDVCGSHAALRMVAKSRSVLDRAGAATKLVRELPPTADRFLSEKALGDLMLSDAAWLYEGGAGSCMGCGEGTAIRMLLAATGFRHGRGNVGLVAATGCNSVFGSTYPYNPFLVPWTNSLFENAATVAMGIRGRWDQLGWQSRRLWVIAGDGAMYDIGFQALSRLLVSGMDVKVLVLDTQVYSNTGGQASGSTFLGQEAKMSAFGEASAGKVERRKELGLICAMHPGVYVAQTTPAHVNHFYRAVTEANAFPGPAVVIAYAPCMPEHGIGDDMAAHQSRLAVESRAFPLFVHDPRRGENLAERLDLKGNPAVKEDWFVNPKTGEPVDFVAFAKTEGRFRKHFGKGGEPSQALRAGQADRLSNWRLLQELAGVR
jgi:pyruvate/2-oxoacid:ferredoxin oxidoreductase alpha subunit/pyruvate/2-oxoacid:ferredoxin oxidoreductase beta subunit/Pyruvate/2-oxoacid:ferredoxin oxidoreductase gamma subunit/ferredoxin